MPQLNLNLPQVGLLRHMMDAWEKHLNSVITKARVAGQELAVINAENDIRLLRNMRDQLSGVNNATEQIEIKSPSSKWPVRRLETAENKPITTIEGTAEDV